MKHIILAEDDDLMRELLTRFLEKESYKVSACASASEALEAIVANSPDLILSDVKMPGMTGPELIKRTRAMGIVVPVIFITGSSTDDLRSEAKDLGVLEILEKPLKDLSVISSAVKNALSCPGYEGIRAGLDELRLSFLTKLAHELRTPITSLRISLDELSSLEGVVGSKPGSKLLSISRRNLGRIITLIERQIELLQIALGGVSISRQLVEVGELFEKTIGGDAGEVDGDSIPMESSEKGKMYLITDPDRLAQVFEWIMGEEKRRDRKNIQYKIDRSEEGSRLVVYSKFDDQHPFAGNSDHPQGCSMGKTSFCPIPLMSESGLEMRACRTVVEALEGELLVEKNGSGNLIKLSLPVLPSYDRKTDFVSPMKNFREAAQSSGKSMDLLRCEIIDLDMPENGELSLLYEFIHRCRAALTEGDAVVRGKQEGMCYLALLDRRPEDVDHIIDYLRRSWNELEENGRDLDVLLLQRITPDMTDAEALSATLDALS